MSQFVSKYPLKIIHAGFHRTGSASVAEALQILGYGPVWHYNGTPNLQNTHYFQGLAFWRKNNYDQKLLNNEDVNLDEWLQLIQCNTIMDIPVAMHWEKFFIQNPNIKVILTVREFDEWYESIQKSLLKRIFSRTYTFVAYFTRPTMGHLYWQKNIYYENYIDKFALKDKELAREKYFEEIEYIKSKVPSEQLLIYEIGSGWVPLCQFVGRRVLPNRAFPFVTPTVDTKKYADMFAQFAATVAIYGGVLYACYYGCKQVIRLKNSFNRSDDNELIQ